MPFANPQYLVETAWLADHLNDPDLRVFDCTVFLRPDKDRGMRIESGRDAWAESHIAGSGFVDLVNDLSDKDATLRFTMPSAAQFAEAIGGYGISHDSRVILYDRAGAMWAARIWWMLRAMGFDNAALLNGGWKKWRDEGRAVSADAPTYPAATFTASPREGLIAAQPDVLAGIDDGATCIVNALSEEQHAGTVSPYGRAGHITSSVNVPAMGAGGIIDAETGAYKSADELQSMFASAGALDAGRVITYCGGGIAASSDAFVLTLLGHENVAVYDASLSEWAADAALPMTNPVEA